jgi:hypothetical protein
MMATAGTLLSAAVTVLALLRHAEKINVSRSGMARAAAAGRDEPVSE